MSIFYEVLKENEALVQAALSDIIAYRERVRAGGSVSGLQAHARADRRLIGQHVCSSLLRTLRQDPACDKYSSALLYYKGYHAVQVRISKLHSCQQACSGQGSHMAVFHAGAVCIRSLCDLRACQVHRIAHQLWLHGQTIMARALQSRIRRVDPESVRCQQHRSEG